MSDGYTYLDQSSAYIDPETGILRNLLGFVRAEDLQFFESVTVSKRLRELRHHPLHINSTQGLFDIHFHLFQDVYAWAGQPRTVEIKKDKRQFIPTSAFATAIQYIDSLIAQFMKLDSNDQHTIAHQLAVLLDHVNYFHPFREGNGRAQREFIRELALQKGYDVNLSPADNEGVYRDYMRGTIESDVQCLTSLIEDLMNKQGS